MPKEPCKHESEKLVETRVDRIIYQCLDCGQIRSHKIDPQLRLPSRTARRKWRR